MQRYKIAREHAGMSQKYAAITLNVAQPSVSDWENGRTNPSVDNLVAMASLYGVSVDYLLGLSDDPGASLSPIKKQPILTEDELRRVTLLRIQTLPAQDLPYVRGFLDGLAAGQSIGSTQPAPPASAPQDDP